MEASSSRRRVFCWVLSLTFTSISCAADAQRPYPERQLRDFPGELGRNFTGLFVRDNLKPLAFGGVAIGVAAIPDGEVKDYFQGRRRVREFGDAGEFIGGPKFVPGAIGVLFLAGRKSVNPRFRSLSWSLAQAATLNLGLVAGAKAAVRRERPNGENEHSFYSGHSANAFTVATVVSRHYGTKASIASYATASLIAVSRLESNKHFLTDVVTGAAVGYIVGRTVTRRQRTNEKPRLQWAVTTLRGGGVAASLAIELNAGPPSGLPTWEAKNCMAKEISQKQETNRTSY